MLWSGKVRLRLSWVVEELWEILFDKDVFQMRKVGDRDAKLKNGWKEGEGTSSAALKSVKIEKKYYRLSETGLYSLEFLLYYNL